MASVEFKVIIKEEVDDADKEEMEEDDVEDYKDVRKCEEEKKARQRQLRNEKLKKRREKIKRILNGEDPSVSEQEKQRLIEMKAVEACKRRERQRLQRQRRVAKKIVTEEGRLITLKSYNQRFRRERLQKIVKGEDTTVSEHERQQILERVKRKKEKDRIYAREREGLKSSEEKQRSLEERRVRDYFRKQAMKAMLTPEEWEEMTRKKSEWHKNHWRSFSEEKKEKKRKQLRDWVKNLEGEKKKRHKESTRKSMKKYMEKKKAEMTEEEKKEMWRRQWEKMTPEQKERHNQKTAERQRKAVASETPEQRRKRLIRYKVYSARTRMKRQLEGEGLQKEEIERRLKVFAEKMKAELESRAEEIPVSEYKPRPRKSKKGGRPQSPSMEEDSWQGPEEWEFSASEMVLDPETGVFIAAPSSLGCRDSPASPPPVVMYPCSFCVTPPFISDTDLREHLRSSHFSVCWKCPKCREVLVSPQELSEHYKSSRSQDHPTTNNEAQPCIQSSTSNEQVTGKFLCMRCPWNPNSLKISFKTSAHLREHVQKNHSSSFWPCSKCHLLKYSKQTLEVHEKLCVF